MKIHELKIWTEHIEALAAGTKTFEIRSTIDRTFEAGDTLFLNEYNPADRLYSGRQIRANVVGVHTGLGVAPGFAILSLSGITKVGGWVEISGPEEPPELKLPSAGPELAAMIQEIQTKAQRPEWANPAKDLMEAFDDAKFGNWNPEKQPSTLSEIFGLCKDAEKNELIRIILIDLGWVPPGEIVPDKPAQLTINEIAEVITRPIHLSEFRISHPRAIDIAYNLADASKEKAARLNAGVKT